MEIIRQGRPAADWERRLEEFLALKVKQGDRANPVANLRGYLSGWVSWLKKERVRPTC